MARPSKLTGEARLTICNAIRVGATFEEACRRAAVAPSTGWEWRARGEGRDPRRCATTRHVLFAEAVARAEGSVPFSQFSQSVEGFAEGAFSEFSESVEGFAETVTERSKEGQAASFAEPQNRCETGEAAGFSEFPESGEGFAEPGFRDTPRDRARAREEEGDGVPSERAWLSQRSRRTSILDMEF